jgi:nucleotide-binding universal stress UspA family protein
VSPATAELVHDFYRARFRADLEQALARLSGKSIDLLDYEEVRKKLHALVTPRRVLKDIPIAAIVGSVGRHTDFTRGFLPRQEIDPRRWARLKAAALDMEGLPPIEAYQIGDAYFVLDGNHRVSVARDLGATHIEAYVTEVAARVSLDAHANVAEIVSKAAYVEFMERTELDRLRPDAVLTASSPAAYSLLERHVELHRYVMSVEQKRGIPYGEAVVDWYDHIYLPVVQVIREQEALRDYPGQTETDLYLAVSGYRALTEEVLDWEFESPDAPAQSPAAPQDVLRLLTDRILGREREALAGLRPGAWRRDVVLNREQALESENFRLFTSLVVPVNGEERGWGALQQALLVARREHGRLLGLFVAPDEAGRTGELARSVEAEFERRCNDAGVPGRLAVAVGEVAPTICDRSQWADMTIVSLAHPPPSQAFARLGSGFRSLLLCCRSPLLAVPARGVRAMERALLAYNGSPEAGEALFVAAYLARRQGMALTVVSVGPGDDVARNLARAEAYLSDRGIRATYHAEAGPPAATVVGLAGASNAHVIVMGGYSRRGVSEMVRGSAVDEVLRTSGRPVLICP